VYTEQDNRYILSIRVVYNSDFSACIPEYWVIDTLKKTKFVSLNKEELIQYRNENQIVIDYDFNRIQNIFDTIKQRDATHPIQNASCSYSKPFEEDDNSSEVNDANMTQEEKIVLSTQTLFIEKVVTVLDDSVYHKGNNKYRLFVRKVNYSSGRMPEYWIIDKVNKTTFISNDKNNIHQYRMDNNIMIDYKWSYVDSIFVGIKERNEGHPLKNFSCRDSMPFKNN
jgi:hypothetical protein